LPQFPILGDSANFFNIIPCNANGYLLLDRVTVTAWEKSFKYSVLGLV